MAARNHLFFIFTLSSISWAIEAASLEAGPIFLQIPQSKVSFMRDRGTIVECSGVAYPDPKINWLNKDGLEMKDSKLIKIQPNGSLSYLPFSSDKYDHILHSTIIRCEIANDLGKIISPPVKISAIAESIMLIPRVYDEFVIEGCSAVLKCQLPGFAKDDIEVVSWYKGYENIALNIIPKKHDKFVMMQNGNLQISKVNYQDEAFVYKCKVRHKVTMQEEISENGGKIHITESRNTIQANIIDFMEIIEIKEGLNVLLPCSAQGSPAPKYSWLKVGDRVKVKPRGTILDSGSLFLDEVSDDDEGEYECKASNSIGSDSKLTKLIILADLQVYIQPERQILDIGKSLIINCSYSGHPIQKVYWYRNGIKLNITGRQLKIKETSEIDVGSYQCFVENDFQVVQAATSIIAGNIKPRIISKFSGSTKSEGANIEIECKAKGLPRPVINWFLDDIKLQNGVDIGIRSIHTAVDVTKSSIQVRNIQVENGGNYKCVATNKVGQTKHSAKINVHGPPYIRPFKNLTVADGEDVTLRCYVSGYPITKIYWTKGIRRLLGSNSKSFGNGTLVIRNIRMSKDGGKYTCTALGSNQLRHQQDVWIKVSLAPIIGRISHPKDLAIGDSVTLLCQIVRGTQPIDIRWLKDNHPVSFEDDIMSSKTSLSSLLQIQFLKKSHEGNYTCVASNSVGKDVWSTKLILKTPPKINSKQQQYSIKEGDDVILNCQAEGNPLPEIQWFKNEEEISSSDKFRILKNGSLHISKLSQFDSGVYVCSANNGIAPVAYIDIQVDIGESPKIFCDFTHKEDENILRCKISGSMPIVVSLFRNNKLISKKSYSMLENGYVKIEIKLSKNTEGEEIYKCLAENKFGVIKKSFKNSHHASVDFNDVPITFIQNSITKKPNENFPNFQSELNEAPIDYYQTTILPKTSKVLTAKESKGNKVTFLQILVASVTTAVIILLFVLLLVLIVLWKKRSDKRDEENSRYYESQKFDNVDEYSMGTLNSRYGQIRPSSDGNFDSLGRNNYYSSITPYATFNPKDINNEDVESSSIRPKASNFDAEN